MGPNGSHGVDVERKAAVEEAKKRAKSTEGRRNGNEKIGRGLPAGVAHERRLKCLTGLICPMALLR